MTLIESGSDTNTLDLLFTYKILQPHPEQKDFHYFDLQETLAQFESFHLITGIICADEPLKTISGGFSISLGSLQLLLKRWLKQEYQQSILQKAINELNTIPSRVNPQTLIYVFTKVDIDDPEIDKSKKSSFHYALTDQVIEFLDQYHPFPNRFSEDTTGEIFLELIEFSIEFETLQTEVSEYYKKSKKLLKILEPEAVKKSILALSTKIVTRELILRSLDSIVTETRRFSRLIDKLQNIADQGTIAWQIVKEAEMTTMSLPKAFESVNEETQSVGVTGDWMVAFSRLIVAHLISTVLYNMFYADSGTFKLEIGTEVMQQFWTWKQDSEKSSILEHMQVLNAEVISLTDFYTEDEVKTIREKYFES